MPEACSSKSWKLLRSLAPDVRLGNVVLPEKSLGSWKLVFETFIVDSYFVNFFHVVFKFFNVSTFVFFSAR